MLTGKVVTALFLLQQECTPGVSQMITGLFVGMSKEEIDLLRRYFESGSLIEFDKAA